MRKIAQDPTYIQISKKRKMSNKPGSRLAPGDSDDEEQNITRMKVDNTTSRLDDDIDRGREMDDDSVIDWEKNLIRGSAIPGPNPEQNEFYNANTDIRPIGVRIREKISDLNERLAETKNNQIRIESEFESNTESHVDTEDLEARYTYFAILQSWLKDYTSFVNSKYGEIEGYVEKIRSLKAEIASVKLRKRQLDVKDSGLQFTFTAPKGGNTNLPVDVKQRIREREARRTKRKKDRQLAGVKNHRIGESSDEEMTNEDQDNFKEKLENLESSRLSMFDDVIEEYVDTRQVLNRFNQFRDVYNKWYQACFIEECAGSVLIPILKVDLGSWEPISSTTMLEEVLSINNCINYSCQPSKPETMLVPFIVSKYPLEVIVWSIESIWDPFSRTQTQNLSNLLNGNFWRSLPWSINGDHRLEKVLKALHCRITRSIAEDVYIPLLPTSHILDFKSDSGQFFLRQWNTGIDSKEGSINLT